MTLTVPQIAQELYNRRKARESIHAFAEFIDVPGRPAREDDDDYDEDDDDAVDGEYEMLHPVLAEHHKLVLSEAEACYTRNTGRLMIFMPPGSAKSTYASVVVPAYLMGKKKKVKVGLFSYGSKLAKKFGRRIRSIAKQGRYASIMQYEETRGDGQFKPVMLSGESSAADEFSLTNQSEFMAAGILGAATGNRFNFLIIDDPIKGREQADSETIRDKTWDAYEDDLKTRLIPGGSVMIIQTRWHEDDLSGRILPENWNGESGDILCKDGNVWRVVCLQAECENPETDPLGRQRGDMLWPEWFTAQHWAQFRGNSRTWGALCQQLPKPADGMMFKPDKIEIVDALPVGYIRWVRGWDLAATEGGGKYTAGFLVGVHRESGRIVLADLVHGQWGPGNRDAHIKNTAVADGRRVTQDFPDDPGAGGTAQTEYIVKKLQGYPVVWGPESGDKGTRAMPAAAECNVGNMIMLRADWNKKVTNELRSFPNGTYTDIGDALSRAYARLFPTAGKMAINQSLINKLKGKR